MNNTIGPIINRFLNGETLPEEEQLLLQEWIKASPYNKEAVDLLQDKIFLRDAVRQMESYSESHEANWNQLIRAIKPSQTKPIASPIRRIYFLRTAWMRYAAAIITILGIGAYLYFQTYKAGSDVASLQPVHNEKDIAPGKDGAVLTLSDGSTVVLDSIGNGLVADQSGAKVMLNNGQLAYNATGEKTLEPKWNIMSTLRGRQFQVILPDGTKVWLNAASSIRYPTVFNGAVRKVELIGEAYFEVAKNERQPFLVLVNNASTVEVLGTHFNINAYAEENNVTTTLVEGSVKIGDGKSTLTLSPGQQSILSANGISLNAHADLEGALAWKNGVFHMQGLSVQAIMRQLSRWYDIDIVYASTAPSVLITGDIPRNMQLSRILKVLEENDVHTKLEGKKLTVLP